jgi:putative ABC transport system substrate-binding protein
MRRRTFIAALGGAAAWPMVARAQQVGKIPRIGVLWHAGNEEEEAIYLGAFRAGLHDLGYVEPQTVILENRFAAEQYDRFDGLAAELVEAKVDALVASIVPAALAAKRATGKIPIVVVLGGDPVGIGLVNSLARPGGNLTGLTNMSIDLSTKQLQIFKDAVPGLSKLALLYNPRMTFTRYISEGLAAAKPLGLSVHPVEVTALNELEHALSVVMESKVDGFLIAPDGMLYNNRKRLAEFALATRLPSIGWIREMAEDGVLISYGASVSNLFRRAATYVDKILKGVNPADLPVEQPQNLNSSSISRPQKPFVFPCHLRYLPAPTR